MDKTKTTTKQQVINDLKNTLLQNIGVKYSYNNNNTISKTICLNASNVADIDKLFTEYATKLSIDKRKNATKLVQLVDLSNNLTSNTQKKHIYATALLDNTKTQLIYDRKEKAYTTTTVAISVAQLAKTCYNLLVFERNNKDANNTTSRDLIK